MQKRGLVLASYFILAVFILLIIGVLGVYAQEQNGSDATTNSESDSSPTDTTKSVNTEDKASEATGPSDLETTGDSSTTSDEISDEEEIPQETEEEKNAELSIDAGITPDSGLYFVEDQILSRFRDDSENREKKIAEIEAMIKEDKIDEARKALNRYRGYADNLENEVDPEKRNEARRSAAAIRNTLRNIEDQIPESEKKEFVENVLEKEKSIVTAVEIAGKIKELCESLAKLDPLEYSKVCQTGNDTPLWQKKLDKKLTKEQRAEAEKFGKIMSECFKTAGQECRCDEIPFTDFAKACSTAAPLATACEIKGDEKACEEMDNLEMPELPSHLQDVFDELENDVSGSRMDLHMPRECVEAKATSPKECRKIMIKANAPEECQEALLAADIQNEREARKICEEIMFKANAPEECIEAGVKDPKECGKIMFKANAPEECIEAGLTGESRSDEKKCREIMESQRGEGQDRSGSPRGFGPDCRSIQNSEERLKCFDGALSGVEQHFEDKKGFDERFKETKEKERQCAQSCASQNKAWDFSGGNCICREGGGDDYQEFYNQRREEFRPPQDQGQFQQPPQGFEGQQPPQEFQQPPSGEQQPPTTESGSSGTTSGEGSTTESGTSSSTISSSSGSESSTSSSSGESSTSSGGESSGGSITGGVIAGNSFLDYFYK